jgi:DNA replication protein DnaC
VRFTTAAALVSELIEARDEKKLLRLQKQLAGALLDRLTHHVHALEMNGDSYRLKQSKRKREPSSGS